MKTDREKLIGLLGGFTTYEYLGDDSNEYIDVSLSRRTVEHLVDYLMSKGVTIPVRCGECKHWASKHRFCRLHGLDGYGNSRFGENGFCSRGERKEE